VTLVAALLMGARHFYGVVSLMLCAFVTVTIVSEFSRGVSARMQASGESPPVALLNLVRRHKRRYGGYIVHFAIVLIFVGFTGQAFDFETRGEMLPGDRMSVRGYELVLDKVDESENDNYTSGVATVSLYKDGRAITTLRPEKRFYKSSEQPTSEVAIRATLLEDLYVVYLGASENGRALIQVYLNPLVTCVWVGAVIMFLGTLLTIVPERRTPRLDTAPLPSAIGLKGGYEVGT
jgi:cytochrome c-type biogenesis protein CcmF